MALESEEDRNTHTHAHTHTHTLPFVCVACMCGPRTDDMYVIIYRIIILYLNLLCLYNDLQCMIFIAISAVYMYHIIYIVISYLYNLCQLVPTYISLYHIVSLCMCDMDLLHSFISI